MSLDVGVIWFEVYQRSEAFVLKYTITQRPQISFSFQLINNMQASEHNGVSYPQSVKASGIQPRLNLAIVYFNISIIQET